CLPERRERDIRGHVPACARREAVRNQAPQRVDEVGGDLANRLARMDRGIVDPLGLETAVANGTKHFERVRALVVWRMPVSDRFSRETEAVRAGDHLIELTEIVEEEVGPRFVTDRRRRVGAQTTQQSIAQTTIRYVPHALLDRL